MGTEGSRPAGEGVRRMARALDGVVSPPDGSLRRPSPSRRRPRAPRCLRRSRRSRTTPSSPTATPAPWSHPTVESAGSACPGSTRRASSGRCWTARPVLSAWPLGINVPSSRIYEPGTNILNTTWHTPTGWAIVRDALTIGPTQGEDEVTPHTRAPADEDGHHTLVRTVVCLEGSVEMGLLCEADSTTGGHPPSGRYRADTLPTRAARG